MSIRKMMLGLGAVVAVVGSVAAEPPVNPLVEGREPNPVVRQFHDADPPTFSYGAGPVAAARVESLPFAVWMGTTTAWSMLEQFTMPLGTVTNWE